MEAKKVARRSHDRRRARTVMGVRAPSQNRLYQIFELMNTKAVIEGMALSAVLLAAYAAILIAAVLHQGGLL